MPSPGERLGPYEILAPIGAGGMGAVYKARDTRLHRDVAIKFSHEKFNERFEREARAVAALNHPNICQLHDVGSLPGGESYLVLEYVEGTPLAPVEDPRKLLDLAVQVADGMAAAHAAGFVHRDLKPDNILVTREGRVKILDFGLARQVAAAGANATVTNVLTVEGSVMGTPRYMAPEQARGEPTDARGDQFSFGLIVYEMATGKPAFHRASVAETMTAIIRENVDPLPAAVPAPIRWVVERCLAKDPGERYDSTRDLYRELRLARERLSDTLIASPAPIRRGFPAAWVVAAMAVAAAVAIALWTTWRPSTPKQEAIHFQVDPPKGTTLVLGSVGSSAISPDGRLLAFVADSRGGRRLWLRPVDSLEARELQGTEGASFPFWSPDSRSIAFFAQGKLKRIAVSGGPPVAIADVWQGAGGAWSSNGTIVFGHLGNSGLKRLAASGGTPVPLNELNAAEEISYRWPQFLPDGRRFLYWAQGRNAQGAVYMSSLDRPQARTRLVSSVSGPSYSPAPDKRSGYLLWADGSSLRGQEFDPAKEQLLGTPFPVMEFDQSNIFSGYHFFSVSSNGTILYSGGGNHSQLAWLNREGRATNVVGQPQRYAAVRLSPDGKDAAVSVNDPSGNRDIWKVDLARGVQNRVTSEGKGWVAVWSPEGQTLAYHLGAALPFLARRPANGAGQETRILESKFAVYINDWSADGRTILYTVSSPESRYDLWLTPAGGDRKPEPYLKTPSDEFQGQFSPDGRWVVYTSDESGRREVYVQALPAGGLKWQVSPGGGSRPRWRPDGRELFYSADDGMLMAVVVRATPRGLEFGIPVPLFRVANPQGDFTYAYDVTRDGERILALLPDAAAQFTLRVLVNWQAAVGK